MQLELYVKLTFHTFFLYNIDKKLYKNYFIKILLNKLLKVKLIVYCLILKLLIIK